VLTTAAFTALVVVAVGFVPAPDHAHAQGVAEPLHLQELFAGDDGFVMTVPPLADEGASVPKGDPLAMPHVKQGDLLVRQMNPDLTAQLAELQASRDSLVAQKNTALSAADVKREAGRVRLVEAQIQSADVQIKNATEQAAKLEMKSPLTGLLVFSEMESKQHAHLKRGDRVGVVADMSHLIVRAAASNTLSGPLDSEASRRVQIRVNGRPDILMSGLIAGRVPAGTNQLPSAALGYQVGGEFGIAADDRQGTKTTENFFEVRIDDLKLEQAPDEIMADYKKTQQVPLFPGQRVVVRFDLREKSLASQAWTSLLQLFQKKFKM
jgi:putative peptide zinc metalloprotease protein